MAPARRARHLQICDALYLGIGAGLVAALAVRSGNLPATVLVAIGTLAYALFLGKTQPGGVPRVVGAYLATWALYAGSSVFVEWLRLPLHSERLLQIDGLLFGQSPAVTLHGKFAGWPREVLALAYMSYHLYLHWVLIDALFRDMGWRAELSERIFTAFGVGFIGYLVFPSVSPIWAFPELFGPQPPGGFFSRLNDAINANIGAKYDAFPSLHALIVLVMLAWDWRRLRYRFWVMIAPSLLMLAATLALGLHYAIDLIASGALFVILMSLHARLARRKS